MSLIETAFCFSPSVLRNDASSKVSSGGGVRPRLALELACGCRNDMQALYTIGERGYVTNARLSKKRWWLEWQSGVKCERPRSKSRERCSMKNLALLAFTLLLCLSGSAVAQRTSPVAQKMLPPPASMDPDDGRNLPEKPVAPQRVDLVQVQRDADALARAAQTIPYDVANVRKGMLPKDVLEKLKQIEKLSKHLRAELNP